MSTRTQGLALAFLGAVVLRLALGGEYLRFVQDWMRWPLVVTGVLLLVAAAAPLLGRADHDEHGPDDGHGVPRSAWLLLLPGLVVFLVAPPALGAYLAERRADVVSAPPADAVFDPLPSGESVELDVQEYVWRAATDDAATLRDRTVRLTGFVSEDEDGWYVTKVSIVCCAADGSVARVLVTDTDPPPRNSWVEVEGVWEPGGGTTAPALAATAVREVEAPEDPYG